MKKMPTLFQRIYKDHIKGIVFWYNDEPLCKIRRKDFGLKWGERKNENN